MKCPHCYSEVRPSKKYPGYYLCDTCRKRYSAASVLPGKEPSEDDLASKGRRGRQANRRKTQKRKTPLYIFLVIFFLLLLAVAAYFLGLFGKVSDFLGLSGKSEVPPEDSPNSEVTDTLHKPKEAVEVDNICVQVLGYEESTGNEWAVPGEGSEFVFVNFEINNNTEEEITVSSMASFESYCCGYRLDYSPEAFTALATNQDRQQMDGAIAGGNTLNGYLCLEVPTDWQVIEIHYSTDVWSNNKVKFIIEKAESQ